MAEGLPATIYRPSIVVGDSGTGEVSEFNVIYPFMKLFGHGILTKLPTRLDNTFNIVPIDFVIRAALAIAKQETTVGKCFHLVTRTPPTIGMFLKLKEEEYPNAPAIHVIDPDDFNAEDLSAGEQMVFSMLRPYMGYLNDHLSFDTRNTEEALRHTGIAFPETDYAFLKILTKYAVDAGYLLIS